MDTKYLLPLFLSLIPIMILFLWWLNFVLKYDGTDE
jgi:hypothetical protein